MPNVMLKAYQESCKRVVAEYLTGKRRAIVHVRGRGGRILATLLAVEEDGRLAVGWSKCNKADPFNRSVGIVKAYRRRLPLEEAEKVVTWLNAGYATGWEEGTVIPNAVRRALPEFLRRVKKRAAMDLLCQAGFTPEKADECRRAIGKRVPADLAKLSDDFVTAGGTPEQWVQVVRHMGGE